MKKIFTLMLAFACALFVGVSCTPDNGDANQGGGTPEPSYPCTLTLEEPAEVAAEGAALELAYTITGESFIGATLSATTEADWLNVTLDEENSKVSVNVSANTSVSFARSASVTLTYVNLDGEALAAPKAVTVKQGHGTPVFNITWSDATPKSVYAQVNAEDQSMTWVAFAMGVSNEQQPDEYFLSQLNSWKQGGMGSPAGLYKNLMMMQMQYGFVFGTGSDADHLVYCKDEAWEEETTYLCVVGIKDVPEALKSLDMNAVYESEEAYMAFMEIEDTTSLASVVHAFKLGTLPAPAVNVTTDVVAPSTAYSQTLDVTVENPYGEGAVTVSEPDAAWLTAAYEDGKLTLTCEENPYALDRVATVNVTYTYSVNITEVDWTGESMTMPREFESTTTVKVSQAKNATVTPITLNIKVKETHFNGIVVDVTPSDSEVDYVLDATWEPRNGWDYQYNNKLDYIGSAYSPTTLYKGNLADHLIKVSPNQMEYNGTDLVIYAFAVNAETKAMISEPVQIPVTVDNSDLPVFTLVCENGIESEGEGSTYYNLNADPGTKVTLKFNVENPAWCGGQILCTTTNDSYNVIDEDLPLIVDQEAGTVTFTVSEYDSSKRYHHCSLGFKYTNADEDNWQLSVSLKVTQNAPAVE